MSDDLAIPMVEMFASPMVVINKPVVDREVNGQIDLTKAKCNGCKFLGVFKICESCPTERERNALITQDLELQMAEWRARRDGGGKVQSAG